MFDAFIQTQIREAAFSHGLPVQLVEAIVQVESGGNPWAMRLELDYRWTLPKAKRPAPCTQSTEDVLQRMSIGPMQVMGAVARELGHTGWLGELCDWPVGLAYGCKHLANLRARYFGRGGWPAVVASYNGGNPGKSSKTGLYLAQAYVDKVLKQLDGRWPE